MSRILKSPAKYVQGPGAARGQLAAIPGIVFPPAFIPALMVVLDRPGMVRSP